MRLRFRPALVCGGLLGLCLPGGALGQTVENTATPLVVTSVKGKSPPEPLGTITPRPFHPKEEVLVDEVRALVSAGRNGRPVPIRMTLVSTVGWGCPCPDFALIEATGTALTSHDEAFVTLESVKGVANIGDFHFSGVYEVTGHYTGGPQPSSPAVVTARKKEKSAAKALEPLAEGGTAKSRKIRKKPIVRTPRRHNRGREGKQQSTGYEVLVTDWCYHPPPEYDPFDCALEKAARPGMRWCSEPPKELCRMVD